MVFSPGTEWEKELLYKTAMPKITVYSFCLRFDVFAALRRYGRSGTFVSRRVLHLIVAAVFVDLFFAMRLRLKMDAV
jgi:hypothetical protein